MKAWSVLLFCCCNTWPQCRVVKLMHGREGATSTGGAQIQGDRQLGNTIARTNGSWCGTVETDPLHKLNSKAFAFTHHTGLFSATLPSTACRGYTCSASENKSTYVCRVVRKHRSVCPDEHHLLLSLRTGNNFRCHAPKQQHLQLMLASLLSHI